MILFFRSSLFFGFVCVLGLTAKAAEDRKDRYSLFHPTPQNEMREFNSDRPGSTNTPYTIDAGHAQFEIEIFNYSEFKTQENKITQLIYPTPNLRIGLTNSTEIGISYVSQINQITRNSDGSETQQKGAGDTTISFKQNLLGNESGQIALAYMLNLKAPTDQSGLGNQAWEPSIMIPLSFDLNDWEISFMPEIDIRKNDDDSNAHSEFNFPIGIGHNIVDTIDGYFEASTHSSVESSSPTNYFFGAGIIWRIDQDMQVDLNCKLSLNDSAPQVNPYGGWTFRF